MLDKHKIVLLKKRFLYSLPVLDLYFFLPYDHLIVVYIYKNKLTGTKINLTFFSSSHPKLVNNKIDQYLKKNRFFFNFLRS